MGRQGHTEVFNKVLFFPAHTDLVLAGKGTVLSQSFFAFLSQF